MNNKMFGYVRVSSKEQNIERQIKEIQELGINERDIFIDKASGKDFSRQQYQALKQCLREGDLLYIKSLDRFGRNYKEIMQEWNIITKEIRADIKVLDMDLLDTTKNKDLLGNFISDLVLQVLSFVAENERKNIKQRQAEGIAILKAKNGGRGIGRPAVQYPSNFKAVYEKWRAGDITAVVAMEELGLKKNTFYKLVRKYSEDYCFT
ncbi:recombinase family protein [Clostridium sp. WILCCON 0269]|uniref:Recombinase family protein n=1 Tax=Candidatus Clostridium eludens TaxID=3381663 RepID=A0ABW8SE78_9CLOT